MYAKSDNRTPLQFIKGIGPKRAEVLVKEGIYTTEDLIAFFPRAYIDRNASDSIKALSVKLLADKNPDNLDINDFNLKSESTIVAEISDIQKKEYGKNRKFLKINVRDQHGGRAEVIFWNYADYYEKQYQIGDKVTISGKAEIDGFMKIQFSQPEIHKFDESDYEDYKSYIIPVYKSPESFKRAGISNKVIRNIIFTALRTELDRYEETLPDFILEAYNFPRINDAIKTLHFPNSFDEVRRAKERMKFEEIFYFELYLALRQSGVKTLERGVHIPKKSALARKVYEALPFELTNDQKKVINEIAIDMASGVPMNRLLQGDVGSGKTIVAALCMLSAVDSGFQVALMAPTEILAEQHYRNFKHLLEEHGINIVQLLGGQKARIRNNVLDEISSGRANIIIGTHSLFESTVQYNKLGLVVIDEQHRFGVGQRASLIELAKKSHTDNAAPHILVMSATPIPRTLALTVYGDLDVSVIKHLPKNRKPIRTKVVFEHQLDQAYNFIREELEKGHQAYIVFPLVEKSEKLELKSAVEHFEFLSTEVFPDYKCGLLHGQMLWYEKEDAMKDFLAKKYNLLVSTTVIEVGIDVPNATVMMINDAHRFGLSQLHQLRGRVGRGGEQSYCMLATKDNYRFEFNKKGKDESEQKSNIIRLKTMERTTDGFEVAEVDLKLRGPGDVLGTRQSGLPEFKFLDLASDGETVTLAKKMAFDIVKSDPRLNKAENSVLRRNYIAKYHAQDNYFDIA